MTQKSKNSIRLWLPVMLMILLPLLSACGHRQDLVVIPADREIVQMDNGNYQVTPAWLQERYRYEAYITEQLDKCRKGNE